jgi:hypothetical protein
LVEEWDTFVLSKVDALGFSKSWRDDRESFDSKSSNTISDERKLDSIRRKIVKEGQYQYSRFNDNIISDVF